jgi:formate hydrogenlyase transcriptional activator
MENAKAIHDRPNSGTTMGSAAVCGFSGCIMPAMTSVEQGSERLNAQLLVDSIPALIHTARPDGYLDYFNKPWLEYLGVTLDKVAGWNWTAYVHPEDVEGIVATWRACLATGEMFEYETRVRRASGEYRWMFHRKVPLRNVNGDIVKWYGSSLDMDERKTAEEQLRRNAEELQRSEFYLAEGQRLAHMGSWAFDPDGFYYWSPELFRMHGLDAAGKPPSIQEYLDRVHPRDRESMADLIRGVLAIASPFDATKRIVRPDGEVRYIRCVGVPVVATQNLKKYVGSAIDVTEHELLTQELRRREAYLTEAQRLSHTGSFGWRPDTEEIVWSDETYGIFECDPAEKPTVSMLLQRTHPQDRALVQQVIENASKTGTDFEHEYRLVVPSGAIKHLHVRAHALHDSSGSAEFIGAVTDITERRAAEIKVAERTSELRRSERELREVIDTIPAIVWSALPDGSNSYANSRAVEYCGMTREQIAGSGWEAGFHPNDLERHKAKWLACVASGEPCEDEVRFRRADGQYRWHLQRGVPLRDEAGNIVKWYGVLTDIEDRRRAEDKIRKQEMELQQILDFTPQQVAVIGPREEPVFANRALLNYFGLRLEEWQSERAQARFHPDDLKQIQWGPQGGPPDQYEARLRRYDGKYRWFLVRNNPLHDEQGQITCWYVAGTDIEDRKQAEDRLRQENVALREEIDKASMFEEIVGTSPALKSVLSRISKVAPSDSTVLITGETGTGKELVARAIHRRSDRVSRPFVSVNCAAIPRDLIASELFGHEKGAFTGATQQRPGRFELANGGTIFLDEVGELPVETQIALLRVLQEHEFERVGGTRRIRSDVRVIAATNRDLQAAISAGSFRSDLFYRLNVFPIEIPSLRERRDDIPLLVEYFIDRYARKAGKNIKRVNKKTLELLQCYPWPGNIRELQNVIERSMILCETETFSIDENWLPQPSPLTPESKQQVELPRRLLVHEKDMIEAALKDTRGRVSGPTGAAAKLGIPRSTLESKIRSLKINKNRFRPSSGT